MSFNIDDYVDVAERIKIFRDKHPEGSLQSDVKVFQNPEGFIIGVLCKATAHRGPDDMIPGHGHSFLEVPGKTPYTKGSEVENAETSAWGRAIVAALAADTKKVASADEVRAKHEVAVTGDGAGGGLTANGSSAPAPSTYTPPAPKPTMSPGGDWTWPFGKHKGKTLADTDTDSGYLDWFLNNSDKEDIKARVREFLNIGELEAVGAQEQVHPDADVPF